ncbi:hypothetical protein D3C87_1905240 [compost metagenome]
MAFPVTLGITPCTIISQTPCAVVQPTLQIQVIAVVIVIAPVAGKAVVQQESRNPFIPLFRWNVATRAVLHRHLRQADVQAL